MRLTRGGGGVMALNVAGMAQALLLQILLARLLGHEGYGHFAYVMAWVNILVYLAVMGHDMLMMRNVAAHRARQEWALLAGVLRHAAGLVGGLGLAPGANIGENAAIFEAVHGTAPDIAGRDLANPIATLLSFAMMLRYSFDMNEDADLIEQAVQTVLNGGTRTSDIMAPGMARCSTSVMGDSIVRVLERIAA